MLNTVKAAAEGFDIWYVLLPIITVLVIAVIAGVVFLIWYFKHKKKTQEEAERKEYERKISIRESVTSQIQQQKAEDLRRQRMSMAPPKSVIDAPREFGRRSVFGSGARTSDDKPKNDDND